MFNESIKMALDGMISNKLRTFLTLLGIIIGVGAVIAMVSLGFGVKENIKNNISKLGSNLLVITAGGRTATGARLAAGEGAKLTYEDGTTELVNGMDMYRYEYMPYYKGMPLDVEMVIDSIIPPAIRMAL